MILASVPAGVYPFDLLLRKTEVLETIGRWEVAGTLLRSCLDRVSAGGAQPATGIAQYCLAKLTAKQGHLDAALSLAGTARQAFERHGEREWLAKALNMEGLLTYYQGNHAQAKERLTRSVAMADAGGHASSRMIALGNLGMIHTDLGEYDQAFICHREQLAYAETHGDLQLAVLALSNLGYLYDWQGDHDRAAEYHERQLALTLRMGDKWALITAYNNLGVHWMEVQQFATAREHIRRSLQLSRELDDPQGLALALVNLGKIEFELGEMDAALDDLQQAERMAADIGNQYVRAHACGTLGTVFAHQGRYQPAETHLRQAIAIFAEHAQRNYLCEFQLELAELYYRMDRRDEAGGVLRSAMAAAEELGKRPALFLGRVLSAKLMAAADRPAARRELEGLLDSERDDDRRARLHYELFLLTRERSHLAAGLTLLAKIYTRTPSIGVKRMLDELKKESGAVEFTA